MNLNSFIKNFIGLNDKKDNIRKAVKSARILVENIERANKIANITLFIDKNIYNKNLKAIEKRE